MSGRLQRIAASRVGAPSRAESLKRRARGTLAGLVAVAMASVLAASLLSRAADAGATASRTLRIDTQSLERRLSRLDAPGAEETLASLAESRDAIRVRLVEALDRAREGDADGELGHRLEELPNGEGDTRVVLRLTIEGRVPHGDAVLGLLAAVEAAGAPWPTEVRGCSLERADAGTPATGVGASTADLPPLLVRCAVDVLHWRESTSA